MNYSTAVFLINPACRAVKATYEEDGNKTQTPYVFKTVDKSIKVGDLVVVPTDTRHKLTVVKVVETDIEIDVDTPHQIKWVVGKVDLMTHQSLIDMEEAAISKIKAAEMHAKRQELAKKLQESIGGLDLKALPMASATNVINGEVVNAAGTPAE